VMMMMMMLIMARWRAVCGAFLVFPVSFHLICEFCMFEHF